MIQMNKLMGVFLVGSFAVVSAFAEPQQTAQTVTTAGTKVATYMSEVAAGRITSATSAKALSYVGGNVLVAEAAFKAVTDAKAQGVTAAEMNKFISALRGVKDGEAGVAEFARLASGGALKTMTPAQISAELGKPKARTQTAATPAALAGMGDTAYAIQFPTNDAEVIAKQKEAEAALQSGDSATVATLTRVSSLLKKAQAEGGAKCSVDQKESCVSLATKSVLAAWTTGIITLGGEKAEAFLGDAMVAFNQNVDASPFIRGYYAMTGQYRDGSISAKLKSCALNGQ